jgi:hypothetical protein
MPGFMTSAATAALASLVPVGTGLSVAVSATGMTMMIALAAVIAPSVAVMSGELTMAARMRAGGVMTVAVAAMMVGRFHLLGMPRLAFVTRFALLASLALLGRLVVRFGVGVTLLVVGFRVGVTLLVALVRAAALAMTALAGFGAMTVSIGAGLGRGQHQQPTQRQHGRQARLCPERLHHLGSLLIPFNGFGSTATTIPSPPAEPYNMRDRSHPSPSFGVIHAATGPLGFFIPSPWLVASGEVKLNSS